MMMKMEESKQVSAAQKKTALIMHCPGLCNPLQVTACWKGIPGYSQKGGTRQKIKIKNTSVTFAMDTSRVIILTSRETDIY